MWNARRAFLPRDARGIAIVSRPSVRPSVYLRYRGHIGWTSSNLHVGLQHCQVLRFQATRPDQLIPMSRESTLLPPCVHNELLHVVYICYHSSRPNL